MLVFVRVCAKGSPLPCRGRVLLIIKEEPCRDSFLWQWPVSCSCPFPWAGLQADLQQCLGYQAGTICVLRLEVTWVTRVGQTWSATEPFLIFLCLDPVFMGINLTILFRAPESFLSIFCLYLQKSWSLCSCAWLTPLCAVVGVWATWQTETYLKTAAGSFLLHSSSLLFFFYAMGSPWK